MPHAMVARELPRVALVFWVLLHIFLGASSAVTFVSEPPLTRAYVGDAVTMEWTLSSNPGVNFVSELFFNGSDVSILRRLHGGPDTIGPGYEGRVSFYSTSSRGVGFRLTDVTLSDAGRYRCRHAPVTETEIDSSRSVLFIFGENNFFTTSGMTFTDFKDAKRAERIVHKPSDNLKSRSNFETMTQSRRDFPEYLGGQPRPARAVEPAVASIDLKFDDRVAFDTEQRSQFVGVDTKTHPVTRMKSDAVVYRPPSVKFETLTNQKLDFRPFDLQDAYSPPTKGPQGSMRAKNLPKMESTTTTNNFYQKWNVQPRVRHGDLHEGHKYTPPTSKFDAMTTTGATFLGLSTDVPQTFKPRDAVVDMEVRREFGTVYSAAFDTPVAAQRLSKSQGQKLLQELRMRKDTRHPVGAA